MFETGIRQFRMAMSMVWGKPIHPRNVERLVQDALKTLAEFGAPGDDVQQLLEGPFTDPTARKDFQNRSLQRTARRLAHASPYYRELFAAHHIKPEKLTVDTMPQIPVTCKQTLQERPQDFITTGSQPFIATRTTGTTGRPAEIWLSRYELELWPALAALSGLLRNEISPRDHLQINISSRATAAVQMNISMCRLVGARVRVLGIIPPDESLDSLLDSRDMAPTMLSTYPSYLAQLIQAACRRGLGPRDFHLRRIDCGGEVLSRALAQAAAETLGVSTVSDNYGMTEILPMTARVCSQGHMHHDLNTGFVETLDLETGKPAAPNTLATLVITPYYPYRECMPVFRYDTRDVVRTLPDEKLTCELAAMPATSRILGKADHLLRANGHVVTVRDLIEAYEALPSQPWPARFAARPSNDHLELLVPEHALNGMAEDEVERHFQTWGIHVRLAACAAREHLERLHPLRADLLETTFTAGRN
jgi:phenylacetate-CoA ligase